MLNLAQGAQGGYQLFLDKHPLKTPGMQLLKLPTERLALAVAAEWEWQVREAEYCCGVSCVNVT